MATELGAFPASGSGSRPTDRASDAVSPVPASIPNADVTLGVGDGRGNLFVHGSYDAIKRVQSLIFEMEQRAWRPLSTAPRDGRVFLSYEPDHPDGGIDFAEWCEDIEEFVRHGCGWSRCTHWMPLPEPPASAIEARRAETVKQGSVHESAVAKPDAHTPGENPHG